MKKMMIFAAALAALLVVDCEQPVTGGGHPQPPFSAYSGHGIPGARSA
jgi:hypothetical protein